MQPFRRRTLVPCLQKRPCACQGVCTDDLPAYPLHLARNRNSLHRRFRECRCLRASRQRRLKRVPLECQLGSADALPFSWPWHGLARFRILGAHAWSVIRTARRSPMTSNSVHPIKRWFTRRGTSLVWWQAVSTIEPSVNRSRSPIVNCTSGKSTLRVQGNQGIRSRRSVSSSSSRCAISTGLGFELCANVLIDSSHASYCLHLPVHVDLYTSARGLKE